MVVLSTNGHTQGEKRYHLALAFLLYHNRKVFTSEEEEQVHEFPQPDEL